MYRGKAMLKSGDLPESLAAARRDVMSAIAASPAIVIIGRNEGERLQRCLASLPGNAPRVYVDSGSSDGSQDRARARGVTVVDLDPTVGFTAARARNAGLVVVRKNDIIPEFVQMIDGDCELDPQWMGQAVAALQAEPDLAAVFGRRRERFPERSLYNKQCDDEWNVPIGYVASCGGDAMFRLAALSVVGDYNPDLIAGEEPDLCLRLSREGWKIKRIDAEMTLHDAALLHFSQWWRRARRSGHAYAEHVWRHGAASIPSWRRQVSSILLWGLAIPLVALALLIMAAIGHPTGLAGIAVLGIYLLQLVRIAMRRAKGARPDFAYAALIVVGKFAEMGGMARFYINRLRGYAPRLIEYKNAS
jgi:glycosyltransferase involved in cell wall biosynthesis